MMFVFYADPFTKQDGIAASSNLYTSKCPRAALQEAILVPGTHSQSDALHRPRVLLSGHRCEGTT